MFRAQHSAGSAPSWRRARRSLPALAALLTVAATTATAPGSGLRTFSIDPRQWAEDAIRGLLGSIAETVSTAIGDMLAFAFNNPLVQVSDAEWTTALSFAAKWGAVLMYPTLIVCVIEIIAGLIASNRGRVLRGFTWAVLAWPVTVASTLIFGSLVRVTDNLSASILGSATNDAGAALKIATTMQTSLQTQLDAAESNLLMMGLLLIVVFIAAIALTFVLGAVTFGQIALAAFAPVALMLAAWKGTRSMSTKWAEGAVTLVLVKPLAAAVIALGAALIGDATAGGDFAGLVTGAVAMFIALFSPVMMFKFIEFTGVQLGGAMVAHSQAVKGAGKSLGRAAAHEGMRAGTSKLRASRAAKAGADTPIPEAGSQGVNTNGEGQVLPATGGNATSQPGGSGGSPAPAAAQVGDEVKDKAKAAAAATAKLAAAAATGGATAGAGAAAAGSGAAGVGAGSAGAGAGGAEVAAGAEAAGPSPAAGGDAPGTGTGQVRMPQPGGGQDEEHEDAAAPGGPMPGSAAQFAPTAGTESDGEQQMPAAGSDNAPQAPTSEVPAPAVAAETTPGAVAGGLPAAGGEGTTSTAPAAAPGPSMPGPSMPGSTTSGATSRPSNAPWAGSAGPGTSPAGEGSAKPAGPSPAAATPSSAAPQAAVMPATSSGSAKRAQTASAPAPRAGGRPVQAGETGGPLPAAGSTRRGGGSDREGGGS